MATRKSRPVTIPSTFVHRKFAELSRRVFTGSEHFIVEKEGLPVMAIISMAEYEEFMKARERREQEARAHRERAARVKRFEKAARELGEEVERLGLSEEQLNNLVEAARQELYNQKKPHDTASD